MKMSIKTHGWVMRILYLLTVVVTTVFVYSVLPEITLLMLGVMLFTMGTLLSMLNNSSKIDVKIGRIAFWSGLIIIIGILVRVDSNTVEYKNENGYHLSLGEHYGDSIKSSYMVYIDDSSKILNHDNMMGFGSGNWFIYVGEPVIKEDFYIEVKESKYLIGKISYVSFYYKGEEIESIQTKKFR